MYKILKTGDNTTISLPFAENLIRFLPLVAKAMCTIGISPQHLQLGSNRYCVELLCRSLPIFVTKPWMAALTASNIICEWAHESQTAIWTHMVDSQL
jgi:hypothetical protein